MEPTRTEMEEHLLYWLQDDIAEIAKRFELRMSRRVLRREHPTEDMEECTCCGYPFGEPVNQDIVIDFHRFYYGVCEECYIDVADEHNRAKYITRVTELALLLSASRCYGCTRFYTNSVAYMEEIQSRYGEAPSACADCYIGC